MGSHSVTCQPAEVTFPPLPQPIKAGTRFSDPRGMQGWVGLVGLVTYRGGIPAWRWSPIPALTGLNVEQLRLCDERRYHSAKLPAIKELHGSLFYRTQPNTSLCWESMDMGLVLNEPIYTSAMVSRFWVCWPRYIQRWFGYPKIVSDHSRVTETNLLPLSQTDICMQSWTSIHISQINHIKCDFNISCKTATLHKIK